MLELIKIDMYAANNLVLVETVDVGFANRYDLQCSVFVCSQCRWSSVVRIAIWQSPTTGSVAQPRSSILNLF